MHDRNSLFESVSNVRTQCRLFANLVRNVRNTPSYVTELRAELLKTENALQSLQMQQVQKANVLDSQQRSLERELSGMQVRFEAWSREGPQTTPSVRSSGRPSKASTHPSSTQGSFRQNKEKSNLAPKEENPEIQQVRAEINLIQKQLDDAGGPNGGWLVADHSQFVRIRVQSTRSSRVNTHQLLQRCALEIPDMTAQRAASHEEW